MPSATAPPKASEVLDAEVVDSSGGPRRNQRQAPSPRKSKKSATRARRDRGLPEDPFEREIKEFEARAARRMREMKRHAKKARRFVKGGKHPRKGKAAVAGMATRAAVVGVAATAAASYLATRTAVIHGRRAYKKTAPRVRNVAGRAARSAYSQGWAARHYYSTQTRRRVFRAVARHRVAGRKRERLVNDPLLHAALVANGQMSTRNMKVARLAAGLLSPQSKRTAHQSRRRRKVAGRTHTPGATRQQDQEALQRADGIRRDPDQPIRYSDGGEWAFGVIDAYPENSAPQHVLDADQASPSPNRRHTPTGSRNSGRNRTTHQGGNTVASVATTGTTNPAAVLEQGFRLSGDFDPVNWVDWMQQMRGQAAAFRQASQSYLQLAVHMDLRRRMDPRALMGIYVIAAAMGQAADVFIATANQFWLLYNDRLENTGRGRTMDDENHFFG